MATRRRNGIKTADTMKNEYGIILRLQARETAKERKINGIYKFTKNVTP